MLDLAAEYHRERAVQELSFMRALRLAIPASLDREAGGDFEEREEELLEIINEP